MPLHRRKGIGEALLRSCMVQAREEGFQALSLSVAAHNGLGAAHLAMFGTDAQKQRFLTPLAKGDKLAAWALTEPGSGSDAAAMKSRAPF